MQKVLILFITIISFLALISCNPFLSVEEIHGGSVLIDNTSPDLSSQYVNMSGSLDRVISVTLYDFEYNGPVNNLKISLQTTSGTIDLISYENNTKIVGLGDYTFVEPDTADAHNLLYDDGTKILPDTYWAEDTFDVGHDPIEGTWILTIHNNNASYSGAISGWKAVISVDNFN